MKINQNISSKMTNMGFVCSCLVVLLHVEQRLSVCGYGSMKLVQYLTHPGIADCAVPYFFIASGFFLAGHMYEVEWWRRECKKRVYSLGIPYVFWNFLYWLFMHLLQVILGFVGISFASDLGWSINFGLNPILLPQHSHLWFVRDLICAVLISPIFLIFLRKFGGWFLIGFIIVCQVVGDFLSAGASEGMKSFAIHGWFRGFAFFAIGIWLRHTKSVFDILCVKNTFFRMFAIFLAFSVWFLYDYLNSIGLTFLTSKLLIVYLLVSVICLFIAVPISQWPKWLTGCAFPIYVVHVFILVLFVALCRVLGLRDYLNHCSLVFYTMYWFFVVCFSIVVTALLKRIKWLKFIWGGRI